MATKTVIVACESCDTEYTIRFNDTECGDIKYCVFCGEELELIDEDEHEEIEQEDEDD